MDTKNLTVDNLRKITTSVEAGTSESQMELTAEPCDVTFIFGIGTSGLTPLEYQLANRSKGESLVIRVQRGGMSDFFGHLAVPFLQRIDCRKMADTFYLKVRITDIAAADNREILKAMAEKSGCGCDCGCGC